MDIRLQASRWAPSALLVLILILAACGGSGLNSYGGGSGGTDCTQPSPSDKNGCTYVTLTDAPGDFLAYSVNVTSLQLTRLDGTQVNMLPNATRVDFAQYDDLTEFLTLASTPPGTYVGGIITLDYSSADIEVQDASGNAVKVSPVDQNGNPVTTLTLTVNLDPAHPLVLVPGVPRLFQVDFNLDASNIVDLTAKTVTVQPFLIASLDPAVNKEQRVRGPLVSVDTNSSSFILGLRPFNDRDGDFGDAPIYTTSSTTFEINQQGFTGSAGLTALASAGPTTAVIAKGKFDFSTHHLVADQVYAGSSVPGGTLDATEGVVVARSGSTLTLRGATLFRAGQTVTFHDHVAVSVGASTVVHEEGDPAGTFTDTDISVGQHLMVFGKLTDTNPASLALDATAGFARLQFTRMEGTVGSVNSTDMVMNLQFIQHRPIGLFDFTGTGSNPASYDADVSGGIAAGVSAGDPVRVFGFVAPFGAAPPDFTAHTVADFANADSLMAIAWAFPGTTSAFTSLDASSGIVPDLGSSPILHVLRQGGIVTDLDTLTPGPSISGDTFGLYAILQNGVVQVHLDFALFVSDLQSRLTAGAKVRGMFSLGGFDRTTDVLSSGGIAVVLH